MLHRKCGPLPPVHDAKHLNCSMANIRIQTTQNIELEYQLAGVGDRLVAYFIDLVIYAAYIFAVLGILDLVDGSGSGMWLYVVLVLPVFCYQLLCEVFLNGQSLGKKAKNIKVISLDGNQPTLGQYLIRWIMRIVDDMMGSGVVAILTISLSGKAQRVGDMLAGTTVVRTKPSTRFQDTIFSASEESYEPIFSLITNLSDKDITLIREVVNRARKHPGNSDAILWKAYERTRKILGEEGPSSPIDFLEAVLRDYSHVTGKDQDRQ